MPRRYIPQDKQIAIVVVSPASASIFHGFDLQCGVMRRYTRHFIGVISLLALALDGCSSSPTRPDAPKPAASVSAGQDPCAMAARLRSKVQPLLESGRLHRSVEVIQKADQLCPASAATTWPPLAATLVELGRYADARTIAANIEADPKASR